MKKFLMSLFLLGLFLRPSQIFAQSKSALSLDISPPVSYLYVKPGAGISVPITLSNNGRYSLKVVPQLVDFHPESQTGRVILEQKTDFKQLSIAGNQDLWGQESIIKPGEEKVLPLVITIPSDFTQGEYHLSLLIEAKQLLFSEASQSSSQLSGIVASHLVILVSLDEEDRSQVEVAEFKVPKFIDSFFSINAQIRAKNIGLNAGPVTGKLEISHWPSTQIKTYELYPDMVLANSERLVRGMSESALAELKLLDQQRAVLEANGEDPQEAEKRLLNRELSTHFYYDQPFLLGAYTFKLELGDEIIEERVLALPFSVLGALVLLPVLYRLWRLMLDFFDEQDKKP